MIELELPFVIPFKSPRRKGCTYYNPLSKEKEKCQWLLRSQFKESKISGPICAIIVFEVGVATSLSDTRKRLIIGQNNGLSRCLKKLDLDNCVKFIADCLKGIVFDDDSQIWSLSVMKIWREKDRTLIYLWDDNKDDDDSDFLPCYTAPKERK
jgi:Holliday junction resolvase RusA-like endonuclease